jgi:hypothetical protein
MGVGESLRRAVGYFGGSYEEYDDDHVRYEADHDGLRERDGTHNTLVLVHPASRDFFLAVPNVFDDVQGIGAHLKASTTVIVDLHECHSGLAERILDFSCGLVYALGGGLYRIGDRVLLLSPDSVDLSTEIGAEAFQYPIFTRA